MMFYVIRGYNFEGYAFLWKPYVITQKSWAILMVSSRICKSSSKNPIR